MKAIISGGAKNGKSTFAENLVTEYGKGKNIYYLATMIPHDREDEERIIRHREERKDKGFITIERGYDLGDPDYERDAAYLLDSITALLSNEMFKDGKVYPDAGKKVAEDLIRLTEKVNHIVFVSDYIYSDANMYDEFTEMYREALAYIDKNLAKVCDRVIEVSFGNIMEYK